MYRELTQEMIPRLEWPFGLYIEPLLPVIVIDSQLEDKQKRLGGLLTLEYVNQEALNIALNIGKAVFWSRSRNELWVKGEVSGNEMKLRNVFTDCNLDVIVYDVVAPKSACHNNTFSCFEVPGIGQLR